MVSLSASTSLSSLHSSSRHSISLAPPSPSPSSSISSASGSASSSRVSLNGLDEDYTITARRLLPTGKSRSQEDLRLLAVSTRITELSYAVSDIETRIFEIQELRHKSQSGDTSSASRVIDQSLASLDERLDSVSRGVQSVNESIEPILQSLKTPTLAHTGENDADATIVRKHAAMLSEWEAVQKESEILREELKEDKWLTVFRTVTDQADGMMSSLEKAINRCQDFIQRMYKRGPDDSISRSSSISSQSSDSSPLSLEVFTTLMDSYEAKKKHYVPATTKVLSIIDKGVQDRVTKNGECLRRHAECTQRWRSLQDRIARTDRGMENVRRLFAVGDTTPSDTGSSVSATTSRTQNPNLLTPPNDPQSSKSKGLSPGNPLSRSISPFRKLARKLKQSTSKSPIPVTPSVPKLETRTPSSEPAPTLRHRASLFNLMGGHSLPLTPERPLHKHTQSLTPDSSPIGPKADSTLIATLKGRRPAWNSSTRVNEDGAPRTVRATPRRTSNAMALSVSEDHSPHSSVPSTPYKRSASRSSMASSRPWSPVTSSVSTAHSSTNPTLSSLYRPPSRAHASAASPAAPPVPSLPSGLVSPRSRPKTPSYIPGPSKHWRSLSTSQSDASWDGQGLLAQRAFSPTRVETPSGHPSRPPSRSMIPLPSVQVSGSRPSSAMSNYRPESSMSFRSSTFGVKPPEAIRTPRPSLVNQPRLPPSSFKDTSAPRASMRPPSRTGAVTPGVDGSGPAHVYTPVSSKDPLDIELASVVNSIPHSFLIERLDPPLRTSPREGEEIRAQYAFSTSLSRKVVTCKLTTLIRTGRDHNTATKKVMCRVGGGWQDLSVYLASRQAGM